MGKLRVWFLLTGTLSALVLSGCSHGEGEDPKYSLQRLTFIAQGSDGKLYFNEEDPERPLLMVDFEGLDLIDGALRPLPALPTIEHVNLRGSTRIGNRGLEYLQHLPRLQNLNLQSTRITDEGLQFLSGLSRLEKLDLSHNYGITSAGLDHLRKLRNLVELDVTETKVTAGGVDRLQRYLPRLKIVWADSP